MPYSSPFHIIHYFGTEDPSDDLDYRRLQKKFMAEFSLPGNSFLTINGQEYSKDELLKVLDGLRNLPFISLHRLIFENTAALSFLEDPKATIQITELTIFLNGMQNHLHYNKMQELLLEAIQESTKHYLSTRRFEAYMESRVLFRYLEIYHEMRIMEGIRKQLFGLIYYLSSYHEKKVKEEAIEEKLRKEVSFLWSEDFGEFINGLPDTFSEVLQTLNETLLYFVAYCVNHYPLPPHFYYRLIDALLKLETLDRYTKNQLYNYRDKVAEEEEDNREEQMIADLVREPVGEPEGRFSSAREEMSAERKADVQKQVNREFLEQRIVKISAVCAGICLILATILVPLTKIAAGFFIIALALICIVIVFWIKMFVRKSKS